MTPRCDDNDTSRSTAAAADTSSVDNTLTYELPSVTVLGTLAELTGGGTVGASDGFGGAGASGHL